MVDTLNRRFQFGRVAALAAVVAVGILVLGSGVWPAVAQTCEQVVLNPGFEDGSVHWETESATGSEIIVSEAAHDGAYSARLGAVDNADDRLWQWISMPEDLTDAGLNFFYRIETVDSSDPPADYLSIQLLDEQDNVVVDLDELHNQKVAGPWTRRVRYLDPDERESLRGRRVRLRFRATTDASDGTTFFVDNVSLDVCTGGAPAISELRMSSSVDGVAKDHFPDEASQLSIAFAYDSLGVDDGVRLVVRDMNGTSVLDHTYDNLVGSGVRRVILTARDAVDGLMWSALDAGSAAIGDAERALRADSRFALTPHLGQAIAAVTVMNNASPALQTFQVGETAGTHLERAREHIDAAYAAGQAAFNPANDLEEMKMHVVTMRDEVRMAMLEVAEVRSAVQYGSLVFPETVDCEFYLTSIYLNGLPADNIQWTVGASGVPARIHPPQDVERAEALRVSPPKLYTQQVESAEAPHEATIGGRVVDADCRPVADGTEVTLVLDTPALGALDPDVATTSGGFFTATFRATDELGEGVATVRAQVGELEAVGAVSLIGPPATVSVDAEAPTVNPGDSTTISVRVVDALGHAVADGTQVSFSVSPPHLGSITPNLATTSNGFASATFVAGDASGSATIRVTAGGVDGLTVVEVAGPAPTVTPAPACDPSDPEHVCNAIVIVRVFEDSRCDSQFIGGVDRAVSAVPVSLIYPDGTSVLRMSGAGGYAYFNEVDLRGDERIALQVEYPEEMVTSGLTPCGDSGTLTFLDRGDFGPFRTASVTFRAHQQIVTRRGLLKAAEVSLCFSANHYLEPTDDGPTTYLVTEQDLSGYLDQEVEVTGSTWEIEFCRYLLPFSIVLVPSPGS